PVELFAGPDDAPGFRPPGVGLRVEEVAHRAGEDALPGAGPPGPSVPPGRLGPADGPHGAVEGLVARPFHDFLDVAVQALLAHLVAPPPEVHGVMRPADAAVLGHRWSSFRK